VRVQVSRYATDVPIPMDSAYAWALLLVACVLLGATVYLSGARFQALSLNPRRLIAAVIGAASARGEGIFWAVWGLIGTAAVCIMTGVVIFWAIARVS
jgi:uncharacterized membrane protein